MRDELLLYYERELTYIRQMAVHFAEKYPKVASRLVLEPTKCEDPHVERLIEAFAFLSARVHLKLDDEFPEITEALLSVVYPHFIRPIPSMSIVEFEVDLEQGKLTTGLPIPSGSMLYSRPVSGVPCKFRTCYDTTLWPVTVTAAEWKTPDRLRPALRSADANAVIRVELHCSREVRFPQLQMDRIRFHLNGESGVVNGIYELLCSRLQRIVFRDPTPGSKVKPVTLPSSALRAVGFAENESMLPYPKRSFSGYALLQEYFTFPEKFFFLDLTGLEEVWSAGFTGAVEILFLISSNEHQERQERLELGISARTFRLGCAPVINLFPQTAEPILLDQRKYEYPIVPDVRRPNATEVFSVDDVGTIDTNTQQIVTFSPFFSFRHDARGDKPKAFWLAHRRPASRINDAGTDMTLSLVDLTMRPIHPDFETITVRTTCTNRDLPARLPFGNETGDFELETNAPIRKIVALKKPTEPLRPPIGRGTLWHLISHLSLNYISIVEDGREAFQQILRLYNFTDSAFSRKMIDGVTQVKSSKRFARVVSDNGISFARGTRVEIELDEEQYVGAGVYLFSSVLEQFLAQYASMNSFSQLVASTRQRKEVLREWPPRAGRKILM